ncbi:MAG: CoA transferase [Dehalococcoidia bacterium]|nr:CoA transferase [Dehalococcoidia bacterium]
MNDTSSALTGITVIDLSDGLAAALASMFLADNGARVIRVVSDSEDVLRSPDIFAIYDRGKEVVRLDLEKDSARFQDLCATADVLLEDVPPSSSVHGSLRLDTIVNHNPRIVHCSITGYGRSGPIRDEPADHDLVAARMGILASQPSYRGGPIHVAHPVAYVGAGLLATMGVAAALYRREKTGRGGGVETSLMAGALLYTPKAVGDAIPVRPPNMTPQGGGPFYSVFECADGEWIQLGCIHSGFVDLAAAVIGVADTIYSSPEEYGDGRWPRDEDARKMLFDLVAESLKTRPSKEWIEDLRAADVPCDTVRSARDAMRDPQILHNGLVHELDDPQLGRTSMVGLPIKFSDTPARVRGPRPELPQHPPSFPPPSPSFPRRRESISAEVADIEAALPLSGVRIMEMTNVIAGPVAGRLLADLGADVVKFESPDGDISRPAGGAGFIAFNAGKRAMSVNTRTDEGKEIERRLASVSDAILANMRPGATDRMGLDADTLHSLNPRLIQSHITAYGWDGPYAQRPGVDPIAQAITGLQRAQGGYGSPPVYLSALAPCDYTGGALGALGTVLALVARERFGTAQKVDTNLLASGTIMCADDFLDYDGKSPRRLPDRDQIGVGPFRRLYKTLDGWIYLAAEGPGDGHKILTALAELDDTAKGAELSESHVESVFGGLSSDEIINILRSCEVPCAPVVEGYNTGFFSDPQAESNGMSVTLSHPVLGEIHYSGNLVSFDGLGTPPRHATPLLGQHTSEVLTELGYGEQRAHELYQHDVVRTESAT